MIFLVSQRLREGAYRDLFAKPDMFPSVDREKKVYIFGCVVAFFLIW